MSKQQSFQLSEARRRLTRTASPLTCVESFCGAGGMSLGIARAGFEVRYAFDLNPAAVETYGRNLGGSCYVKDARKLCGAQILRECGLDELDLFTGGPPCQGFSKQKRGAHENLDERNALVREYVRLVSELSPRAFIFENVQIFGQKRGAGLVDFMENTLANYRITKHFVCASDFGLAQRRPRFLMIGIRSDVGGDPPVIRGNGRFSTIRDAIGDLPPPPADFSEHKNIPNHIRCRITALNEQRFRHVPPGGGWPDIPEALRLKCHQGVDASKGGWPDVYGRLEWGGQCPTITAGFDSFTRGRYGHPVEHRSLTLREGARIQGFPDSFRFYGTRADIRLQIGNAVPPPLAEAAGQAVRKILDRHGSTLAAQTPYLQAAE